MATRLYAVSAGPYPESNHANVGEMLRDWRERVMGRMTNGGYTLESVERVPIRDPFDDRRMGHMLKAVLTRTIGNGFQVAVIISAYAFDLTVLA